MRSFFRILLFVLPLTLLTSLPCDAKREIKRHLKVLDETTTSNSKTKHITSCLEEDTSSLWLYSALKLDVTGDFPLPVNKLSFLTLQEVGKETPLITSYCSEIIAVPLFILYKKLMVYS